MSGTILVVDDEQDLVGVLRWNLEHAGYSVRAAGGGKEALLELRREPLPDLVLLDLMLPDLSGTEVCRRMRQDPALRHIPVIMLTARGEEIDRVVGFEVGADDYVVKPFSVRELMLRVRAVLRRRAEAPRPGEPEESQTFGRLEVNPAAHQAWVDGVEVELTALEFRLLHTFLERRGRVQTRDTLLDSVWGIQADVTTRTVDTHVKRLRQKLGPAGRYVETVRGVGYRIRSEPNDGGGS